MTENPSTSPDPDNGKMGLPEKVDESKVRWFGHGGLELSDMDALAAIVGYLDASSALLRDINEDFDRALDKVKTNVGNPLSTRGERQ